MTDDITVYVPDNSIKKGYRSLFREMFSDFRETKYLMWQLMKRDIKSLYMQSFLGILWVIIPPLVTVGTFIFLNQAGIFDAGDITVPYPLYALLGVALWQLFSNGLTNCTNALVKGGSMIAKINFPREALVFSAVGQAFVRFIIQAVVVIALIIWYFPEHGLLVEWTSIFLPLFLIPIILLFLGLGLILSIINGVVRDVGQSLPILMTFLMFLTPILYSMPESGFLETLTTYNPLYYLVVIPRDMVFIGFPDDWTGYALSSILAVFTFFACWMVFHLTETRIAERI